MKYLSLYAPSIIYYVYIVLALPLLFRVMGFPELALEGVVPSEEIIQAFIEQYFGKILASLLAFVLVTFFFGALLTAIKLSLVRGVVTKKKVSLLEAWRAGKKVYWNLIGVKIYYFVVLVCASLISLAVLAFTRNLGETLQWSISLPIVVILFVVVALHFFFLYPALFLKEYSVRQAVRASCMFFKGHKRAVIGTALLIVLVGVVFNIALSWIKKYYPASVGASVLVLLISLVFGVWTHLLKFNVFYVREHTKSVKPTATKKKQVVKKRKR